MATLTIPHAFVAGTPALASEVNANFQAVVSWTQGQISTDNLGILGARSVALPSSPTLAILSLAQTSSNIALNISNSGTESALAISQSGALANGKGAILINSPSTQSTVGAAEILMTLNTNSSIPALLVKHGAVETLSATKDEFDLFASAVEISAARLKLPVRTTAQRNAVTQEGSILYNTSLKNIAFYNGVSWAPPVLLDNSTIEYSNEVARIKDLGVTTAKIANLNVTRAKLEAVGQITAAPSNYSVNGAFSFTDIPGASVTITTTGRPVLVIIDIGTWQMSNNGNGWENNRGGVKLVRGGSDLKVYYHQIIATDANSGSPGTLLSTVPFNAVYFDTVASGTYTYKLQAEASYQVTGSITLNDIKLTVYEL